MASLTEQILMKHSKLITDLKRAFFQLSEWLRALCVGAISFGLDTVTLFCLTEFVGIHYLLSAGIGFLIGSVVSYFLNTRFVFNHRTYKNKSAEFVVFFFIGVAGLGIHESLLWLLTDKMGVYYLLSKFMTAIALFLWNYIVRKLILFRQTDRQDLA